MTKKHAQKIFKSVDGTFCKFNYTGLYTPRAVAWYSTYKYHSVNIKYSLRQNYLDILKTSAYVSLCLFAQCGQWRRAKAVKCSCHCFIKCQQSGWVVTVCEYSLQHWTGPHCLCLLQLRLNCDEVYFSSHLFIVLLLSFSSCAHSSNACCFLFRFLFGFLRVFTQVKKH